MFVPIPRACSLRSHTSKSNYRRFLDDVKNGRIVVSFVLGTRWIYIAKRGSSGVALYILYVSNGTITSVVYRNYRTVTDLLNHLPRLVGSNVARDIRIMLSFLRIGRTVNHTITGRGIVGEASNVRYRLYLEKIRMLRDS